MYIETPKGGETIRTYNSNVPHLRPLMSIVVTYDQCNGKGK